MESPYRNPSDPNEELARRAYSSLLTEAENLAQRLIRGDPGLRDSTRAFEILGSAKMLAASELMRTATTVVAKSERLLELALRYFEHRLERLKKADAWADAERAKREER